MLDGGGWSSEGCNGDGMEQRTATTAAEACRRQQVQERQQDDAILISVANPYFLLRYQCWIPLGNRRSIRVYCLPPNSSAQPVVQLTIRSEARSDCKFSAEEERVVIELQA